MMGALSAFHSDQRQLRWSGKKIKEKEKKLNKRYLPAIASLLIVAVLASSFLPVFAVVPTLRYRADPSLVVKTIAEDDELRQTGIILMADSQDNFAQAGAVSKLLAQFKVIVTYNGQPVKAVLTCQIIEKDKYNPLKAKQGIWENLVTSVIETKNFLCKYREGKTGVGVLDVYYTGSFSGQFIADYIVVVKANFAIGRTVVYGAEMQDVCVLGWPIYAAHYDITKPDGTHHFAYADPLGDFVSCEDAALVQHQTLNIPIPWT
jgi:hypothetical protein